MVVLLPRVRPRDLRLDTGSCPAGKASGNTCNEVSTVSYYILNTVYTFEARQVDGRGGAHSSLSNSVGW
ncbi:hypothetical protein HYH03_018860, partial [Edaphochlamys debaryana]